MGHPRKAEEGFHIFFGNVLRHMHYQRVISPNSGGVQFRFGDCYLSHLAFLNNSFCKTVGSGIVLFIPTEGTFRYPWVLSAKAGVGFCLHDLCLRHLALFLEHICKIQT